MAFYTVLTPPAEPGDTAIAQMEQTVFLKDGFVIFAFVFTGLWLLSKRLWLPFAIFLGVWAMLGFGGRAIGIHPMGLAAAQALIGLFLGLEGQSLIERKLVRKGWRVAGVVEGKDTDTVERRFFEFGGLSSASVTHASVTHALPPATNAGPRAMAPGDVLGLFPDAQGRS